jgi:glycylpeptide N-tetradecanoyltransferase
MPEESKQVDAAAEEAAETLTRMANSKQPTAESDGESDQEDGEPTEESQPGTEASKKKNNKKKSKRKKLKEVLSGKPSESEGDGKKAVTGLTHQQITELMQLNPALAQELAASGSSQAGGSSSIAQDPAKTMEALKRLNLQDIMTGLASSGKNVKDMASYKFWSTQPVMKLDESADKPFEEGPLKIQKVEDIPTSPAPLGIDKFEWVTMDLTQESQLKEVYELLNGHYVEDEEAMFRFKYGTDMLKW